MSVTTEQQWACGCCKHLLPSLQIHKLFDTSCIWVRRVAYCNDQMRFRDFECLVFIRGAFNSRRDRKKHPPMQWLSCVLWLVAHTVTAAACSWRSVTLRLRLLSQAATDSTEDPHARSNMRCIIIVYTNEFELDKMTHFSTSGNVKMCGHIVPK